MKKYDKEVLQSLLNSEEEVIAELEKTYKKALKDIDGKIEGLMMRSDADMQHVIYQIEYQKAMKKEIEGILDVMNTEQFSTISDYLVKSYENGFVGTMYSLQKQGIPLCFPLEQKAIVQAVLTNSKISKGLYNHLGENVSSLKKSIMSEVSRGISTGSSYSQVAQQISRKMIGTYNNPGGSLAYAQRIARTEGHRIQIQSAMDACYKARENGADVVKQWDSTLDKRTRKSHKHVDGEIQELDDPFSNGLMFPGDPSGGASEVVNCRCALLQRARWALDDDELETLKKRAEYYGLDKTKNFEEFQKKYLKTIENYGKGDTIVLSNIEIGKSIGAKAKNYDILDPETGEYFHFVEGTKIKNAEVFAGSGVKKPLNDDVSEGLAKEFGGNPNKWQHAKGIGMIDYNGEELEAEVHWFQEETVGKVKFKVKKWLE